MTILAFPRTADRARRGWRAAELQRLTAGCTAWLPQAQASGWEYGETEAGDPQLYLIGPAPDHECILSISRLGRHYVLEDGNGRILFEHDNLVLFAEQVTASLRSTRRSILAQVAVAWCAMREFYEEKVEPALAEPVEVLSHVAPQLAALA